MERRNRAEILFHEALALEPSARTSFLKEACSGEPELLEEVVSLISAHERPWSFIDSPANYLNDRAGDELSESLIGTSIGRYQVVRLIKRSGMGEVYLARDTHLPREVALKLLPLMFTGDESRLRRFILEAEAASSLNHPNIITIHEIGHIRDVHYIATEFVDGQTLRERLSDGPLELNEAVEIAVGVANALVASHAAGIVHRDIKPENIMIRRDGYVKVLDFGLAKLTERPDVRIDGRGPNISSMDTDPGTFMGTVGYLSPEQAKSLEVDTRSDVFSLGVVLYEMVAGQNPFNRDAFSDVINAILTIEPEPLASLVPNTPASLQKIVTKTLAKDKQNRYQRTEDLLADLKAVQAQLQPRKLTPRERWWRIGIGVAAVIAITSLIFVAGKMLNRNRGPNAVSDLYSQLRYTEIQNWKSERGEGAIEARFSHDGQMIAFMMVRNGWEGIWIKQALAGAEPQRITQDGDDNNWPVWSPDDQRVAFISIRNGETGIWTSSAYGGQSQRVGEVRKSSVRTKAWSKDGKTIYYEAENNLYGLDINTGASTQLTKFDGQSSYRDFRLSLNEDRLCYINLENGQTDVWVAGLHGEEPFNVTKDAAVDRTPFWHPDGKRIVYTSNRGGAYQVCVAHLDGSRVDQVTAGSADHALSDISKDGTKLLDVDSRDIADIFSVDAQTGRESEITSGSGLMLWPDDTPDGQKLALQSTNSLDKISNGSRLFVKKSTSEGAMTEVAANGFSPVWSPDGGRLAFLRFVDGHFDLFTVGASGEEERRLTTGGVSVKGFNQLPATKFGTSIGWFSTGEAIVYVSRASGVSDLWTVALDGTNAKSLSVNTDRKQLVYEPVIGPGGQILFAVENRNSSVPTWSLWVTSGDETRRLYESKSLLRPLGWSHDGSEIVTAYAEEEGYVLQGSPLTTKLARITLDGQVGSIQTLKSTYLWSVQLSSNGRNIAFVSDQDKADNIWLLNVTGDELRKITANVEAKVFFPSLNWSRDGGIIYFGKQSSVGLITMIDNFE